MAAPFDDANIESSSGSRAAGFILGSAVADRLGAGFVPVRKLGKLPSATIRASYALEYGTDSLEMHRDAVSARQRVLIVDDLLATGGTARRTLRSGQAARWKHEGIAFLIELEALKGRARLEGENIHVVLKY